MQTPTLKTIIFFILFFLISSIIFFFLIINLYDQNSFLNYFENKIISFIDKKVDNKISINHNYNIINIDKKISSENFKNLLYFINEINTKYIFIDLEFDRLKDTSKLTEIENYINNNTNVYGILHLLNKKGLKFSHNIFNNDLLENTIHIKSKYPYMFSNYLDKLRIKNIFSINSDKIGFINNNYSIFNNNNIDLFFRINKQYIMSSPFIIQTKEKKFDNSKFEFQYSKIKYPLFYFDQKGKMSFIHNNFDKKKDIQNINNFNKFDDAFKIRTNIIDKLKSINLFQSEAEDIELFKTENIIINEIYNIPELNDEIKNKILSEAKNEASKWKAFKNVNQDKMSNSYIFIVQNENYNWISDFFYQKDLINNGIILKKIPLIIIIISLLTILFMLSLINYFIKNEIFIFLILLFLSFLSLLAYFSLRIYFHIDFPFLTVFIIILFSFFTGRILKKYNNKSWFNEVKSIYKGSISQQFAKKIAAFWKYKNWDLQSKQYLCTFLYIDKSIMLKKDISENDVELIGAKNSEIESIIKNNNGIRNTFTPTEILCYFGNPPIYKNHHQIAVKTVFDINNIIININNEKVQLRQALHSKEEWFKFVKKENQKYYTYFGNSINILSAMIQYAKKFNINLIISESVYKLSKLKLPVRMLDRVKIEGIKGTIRLFELLEENYYNDNIDFYNYFHAGLKLYENKKWKEAGAYFRQCLKINKDDTVSKKYLDRCRKIITGNNIDDWVPIYEIS